MQKILTKENRNKSGLYQIRNNINGKIYIGQTKNFNRRANQHKSSLNRGKHYNHHLQASVKRHRIENFVFEILEIHEENLLDEKEAIWLNAYCGNREICYNHDKIVKKQQRNRNILSEAIKLTWVNANERKEKLSTMTKERFKLFPEQSLQHLRKTYNFIDPNGIAHETSNLKNFTDNNGLSYEMMRKMSKGTYVSHHGWTSGQTIKVPKQKQNKTIIHMFLTPEKEIVETRNIAQFSKSIIKANKRSVFRLIQGEKSHVKNWKFIGKKQI